MSTKSFKVSEHKNNVFRYSDFKKMDLAECVAQLAILATLEVQIRRIKV
jgi:hypothetical protein